jgi:alpha-1,3-mannosyltransferase
VQVFTYKWSVNWQFLPEPAFLSRQLALFLLLLHLRLLWALARARWLAPEGGLAPALRAFFARSGGGGEAGAGGKRRRGGRTARGGDADSFEDSVLFLVLSSGVAGIVASRTIHYQFYSWWAGGGGAVVRGEGCAAQGLVRSFGSPGRPSRLCRWSPTPC